MEGPEGLLWASSFDGKTSPAPRQVQEEAAGSLKMPVSGQAPDAKPLDLLGKEHFEVDLYVDLYEICMIALYVRYGKSFLNPLVILR